MFTKEDLKKYKNPKPFPNKCDHRIYHIWKDGRVVDPNLSFQEVIDHGANKFSLAVDSKEPDSTFAIVKAKYKEKGFTVNDSFDQQAFNEALKDHEKGDRDMRVKFRDDLAAKHGLTLHPKLAELWSLAWKYGHSAGLYEVQIYFEEMAVLLKD